MNNDFDAARDGWRMPAEWEPMAATWLGWPVYDHREELWGEHYVAVCCAFGTLARCIARYQRCIVAAQRASPAAAPATISGGVSACPVTRWWSAASAGPDSQVSTQPRRPQ